MPPAQFDDRSRPNAADARNSCAANAGAPLQYIVFGRSRCTVSTAIVHTTRLPRKSSIMISTEIPPGAVKQISVGERHPPQPPRFRSATPD